MKIIKVIILIFFMCEVNPLLAQKNTYSTLNIHASYIDTEYKGEVIYIDITDNDENEVLFFTKFGYLIQGKVENNSLNLHTSLFYEDLIIIKKVIKLSTEKYIIITLDGVFEFNSKSLSTHRIKIPFNSVIYFYEKNQVQRCIVKSNATEFILYENNGKWREIKKYKIEEDLFDLYLDTGKIAYVTWSGRILIENFNSKGKIIDIQVGLVQDVSFSTEEINILTNKNLIKIDYNGKEIKKVEETKGFSISASNDQSEILVGEAFDDFSIYDTTFKKNAFEGTKQQKINATKDTFKLPNDSGSVIQLDLNTFDTLIQREKSSILAIDVANDTLMAANSKNELTINDLSTFPYKTQQTSLVSYEVANLGPYLPPLGIVTNLKYAPSINHVVYTTINGHTAIKYWNLYNNKQGCTVFGFSPNAFELSNDGTLMYYTDGGVLVYETVHPFLKGKSRYKKRFKHKYTNTKETLAEVKVNSECSIYNNLLVGISPSGAPIIWNIKKHRLTKYTVNIKSSFVKFISEDRILIIDINNNPFEWNLSTNSLEKLLIALPSQFKKIEFYKDHIIIFSHSGIYVWKENKNKYLLKKHLFPIDNQVFTDISVYNNKLYVSSGKYDSEKIKLISEGYITNRNENYYISYIKEYANNQFFICTSNGLIKFIDFSI